MARRAQSGQARVQRGFWPYFDPATNSLRAYQCPGGCARSAADRGAVLC
jgi:hypothetical protein